MQNRDVSYPDEWVILRVYLDDGCPWFRLFVSFFGDYANGDSWRLNSGITKYEVSDEYIDFYSESGSVYTCPIECFGITSNYSKEVLSRFTESPNASVVTFEEFVSEFRVVLQ